MHRRQRRTMAEEEDNKYDDKIERRRQRQREQRRAEVLDSSDDEDDNDSARSGRSGVSSSDAYSQSSTSVMNNLSTRNSSSLSKTNKLRAMDAFDVIREGKHGGTGGSQDEAEISDDSTSDDDELMNPYVMNPFPNHQNGNDSRLTMLDYSTALLPPSIELAAISSKQGGRGDSGVTAPLQPQLSPHQPCLSEQEKAFITRTQPKKALASFDPYGPNNGKVLPMQQQQRENPPPPHCEMEMEEESIEFISNTESTNDGKSNGQGLNVFGPLLDEPSPSMNQDEESSFSPFPKHRSKQTFGEYGESTPLSSSEGSNLPPGFAARHGRGQTGRGGILGILGAFVNVIKAIVSSVAYFATSLLHGDQTAALSNNPFSDSRRLNVRMSNRQHWGVLSYFRLLVVSLAALFCAGTVTMMYQMSNADYVGTNIMSKRVYQKDTHVAQGDTEISHRPSSIVLKRMGTAKQKVKGRRGHWWNRNKAESSVAEKEVHTEVYQHGKKQTAVAVQEAIPLPESSSFAKSSESIRNGGGKLSNAVETLPVIVQTEEDGTLLIKLPPPKTHLQEPSAMGGADPMMGSAENQSAPPLGNDLTSVASNGDETMYIKLPYPQQQQQQRRTLTEVETTTKQELEPPLRGAAVGGSKLIHHPPPPLTESQNHRHHTHVGGYHSHQEDHGVLNALRKEFDSWVTKHDKNYGSGVEKEHRFHVWRKNHLRIQEKNQKHGPCRMTGKAVFGHNMFSDLDPEEFQSKFLTGYRGPQAGMHNQNHHGHKKKGGNSHFRETTNASHRKMTAANEPPPPVKRHPSIQRKLEEHNAMYGDGGEGMQSTRLHGSKYQSNYLNGCSWWDVSCLLRWIFSYQYIGGTREPVYDENSYPSALDWRSMGVVTQVHSQGSCGACWAITAVETIESANAIATGELIDLAEEEVIACDGTCEMCNGGWPQNAYDYVMKHKGLPKKSSDYDADWLYTITAVLAGESDEASEYDMGYYFAGTCPNGYREGEGKNSENSGSQHSGDGGGGGSDQYDVSYVETTRYGAVKGYGYATDRCICYTDGSGCDCDEQDEKTAVLNVASYGPAAVCLEASLWQDYEGGIMTSDIGCSSSFLDMNHCVEVVGYAFTDGSSGRDEDGENYGNSNDSGSGSNDRSGSGSGDDQREGYWIVKNQWSNYWGMNGYAYVAMGENTCGILNDMTQVYMDD